MLSYVGSYDFEGFTAIRQISEPALARRRGFLFVFVIRQRVSRENGDECLFQFMPVFVSDQGQIDESALYAAVTKEAAENPTGKPRPPDSSAAFELAKQHIEEKLSLWDWIEEVEFVGLSWVEFK